MRPTEINRHTRFKVISESSTLLAIVLVAILLITASLFGFGSFMFTRYLTISRLGGQGSLTGVFQAITGSSGSQTAEAALPGEAVQQPESANPLSPAIEPDLVPWDGASRVTLLLLGLDYRDWQAGEKAARSDTMILLTLDPINHSAGILSIPRDMWVAIPGFQHGKINTAHYLGDAYHLPGGGPGLAVDTVEQFLGVPINFYAQVDFAAFIRFIDEIGGVKLNIPEPITIDLLGSGVETKKRLTPGIQVLPGEWALAYARARYTSGGDFDRAERQQQVILAIRDRVLSFEMLPVLISKADVLYQELASGIHTNLNLDQAIQLATLASQIPEENIRRGVIGKGYVLFGHSPDDLSILIPLMDKVHGLRDEIFTISGSLGPLTAGTNKEKMRAENASLAVLDATQNPGLFEQSAEYLRSRGLNVISQGIAPQAYSQTVLIDHRGRPHTLRYLLEILGLSPTRIRSSFDPSSPVDIKVILGSDWVTSNPLP